MVGAGDLGDVDRVPGRGCGTKCRRGPKVVVGPGEEVGGPRIVCGDEVFENGQDRRRADPALDSLIIDREGHVGAEAVAAEHHAVGGVHRIEHGDHIGSFGVAATMFASGVTGPTEVEADRLPTGGNRSFEHGSDDRIVA